MPVLHIMIFITASFRIIPDISSFYIIVGLVLFYILRKKFLRREKNDHVVNEAYDE